MLESEQRRRRGSVASGLPCTVRATIQIGSWWLTTTASPLSVAAWMSATAAIIRSRIETNGSPHDGSDGLRRVP